MDSYVNNLFFSRKSIFLKMLFSSLFLLPSLASSIELSGNIGTDVEHTSNALTAPTNKKEDVIQRVGIELSMLEERKNLKADANISLDHEHYYNDSYEDETSLTSGFGLFSIDLIENFFNWQATFSRTDVLSDSSQDENPDTREYRNIVRTGPTISYAMTRTLNMQMAANYVYLDNSGDSAIDSKRADANVRLQYQFNPLTDLSGSVSYDEVLDSDDGEEITSTNWSVGLARRYTGGALNFNVGQQKVSSNRVISDNSDETDSTYFDIRITRERFLAHNISLSYLEEVTDTAIGFESDESGATFVDVGSGGAGPVADTSRVNAVSGTDFENRKRTTFSADRDFTEFTYDLSATYQDSEFERAQTTERYRSVVVGLQPKLYTRLVPRIQHSYTREDFSDAAQGEDVARSYELSVRYEAVSSLFLNANARFEKIDNDEDASRESEEFSLGLGVNWEFL